MSHINPLPAANLPTGRGGAGGGSSSTGQSTASASPGSVAQLTQAGQDLAKLYQVGQPATPDGQPAAGASAPTSGNASLASSTGDGGGIGPAPGAVLSAASNFSSAISFSQAGQLFSQLNNLAETNPSEFQAVTQQMAQQMQSMSYSASGPVQQAMASLASTLQSASKTGSASGLTLQSRNRGGVASLYNRSAQPVSTATLFGSVTAGSGGQTAETLSAAMNLLAEAHLSATTAVSG